MIDHSVVASVEKVDDTLSELVGVMQEEVYAVVVSE